LNFNPVQKPIPAMTERRVISGPPTMPTTYREPLNGSYPQQQQQHRITNDDDALPYYESRSLDIPQQRAATWNAPPPKAATRVAPMATAHPSKLTTANVGSHPQPLQSSPTSYFTPVFQPQPQRQRHRSLTREQDGRSPPGSPLHDQQQQQFRGGNSFNHGAYNPGNDEENQFADDNDDNDLPQSRPVQRDGGKLARHFGAASEEESGRFYTPTEGPQGQAERSQQEKRGRSGLGAFMRRLSSSGGRDGGGKFKAGW